MKKVLLDTNVILDAIAAREPFRKDAEGIFLLAAKGKIQGCVTASSLTDIYYIARKQLDESAAREALRNLLTIFTVLDVRGLECKAALDLAYDGFEDALMAVCGRKAGMNYIITRDEKFLQAPSAIVPTMSPSAFLAKNKTEKSQG